MTHATLFDLLRARVETTPDRLQYRFIERCGEVETLTCLQLWHAASAVSAQLLAADLAGERVLIACGSQRHTVVSLFACLLAGAVAVPAPPLASRRLGDRVRLLAADARAALVIVDADAALEASRPLDHAVLDLRVALAAGPARYEPQRWPRPRAGRGALAYLQYTSGATGDPKGVMVTHGNVLANCADIASAMAIDARSRVLTPLPLYHDMGLVGGVFVPLHAGCVGNFIEPGVVAARPELWLEAIGRCGVTHSGGPTVLFELAAALPPERTATLDLSSWAVACCGAEPIRAAVLQRFAERFARHGFRAASAFTCYGLAECTLFVAGAGGPVVAPAARSGLAASPACGRPTAATRIAIVDPASRRVVPPGRPGEIWVQGPSVAAGYWGRRERTRQAFEAFTDRGDGPWLRTGDLGSQSGGVLKVHGRLEDLVVLRGRTLLPQDLEDEAGRAHEAVRFSAAFTHVEHGVPRLAVVAEAARHWLRRDDDQRAVARAIGDALAVAFGIEPDDVEVLQPGSVPRTSSGKVQRMRAREQFRARRALVARHAGAGHRGVPAGVETVEV